MPRTNADIDKLLEDVRRERKGDYRPVLAVNIAKAQVAANGGYPVHMYHETLLPRIALHADMEAALTGQGYHHDYKKQSFPRYLFKRNLGERFLLPASIVVPAGTPTPAPNSSGDYVEFAIAHNESEEGKLLKRGYMRDVGMIEPMPEELAEDPEIKSANLEGENKALRDQLERMMAKK